MVWSDVDSFMDGVSVLDAKTLNRPIQQLASRTNYLKQLLDSMGGRTNITVADAELSPAGGALPSLGQPVYRVAGGNAYAQAAAIVGDVEESKWFWADQRAMAVGVVGSTPSGSSATVVLSGYVAFDDLPVAQVIADANPESGRYFLSMQAGKLTAAPSGPIIYVCDCEIRDGKVMSMLVNPQYRDTGESHIHRAFVLSGLPLGGYSVRTGGRDLAPGIASGATTASAAALPTGMTVLPYGYWATSDEVTYTLQVVRKSTAVATSTSWSDYLLKWTSGGADGSKDDVEVSFGADGLSTELVPIGSHGLSVRLALSSGTQPGSLVGSNVTWTIAMPDAARAWVNYKVGGSYVGFRLNLGMYLEMARFVPPLPANGAELTVGGIELRGAAFGDRKRWEILPADDDGGPWLVWYGGVADDANLDSPFEWNAVLASQKARDIVLHVNRMRVGPTGFVTSLQAAPGSPLKVTSAQTGATAAQGALQVGLDIDFKSTAGGAEGHEVVKRIKGSTFVTGPVVERVVAGPGMSVDRQQGVVTVSAANAVYAGDFETIALRNAKQDLAGDVFPYTKLLRWNTSGTNIDSGFTAKFRVPDHIPYNVGKGYYVVVSASVFGEEAAVSAATAAFRLTGYALADQACTPDASGTFDGSIASPAGGYAQVIGVPFAAGYAAFDPVLVHGFGNSASAAKPGTLVLPDTEQRVSVSALWLLASASAHMVVYPGYFVGLSIERCAVSGSATPYVPAIGVLSLRWNLVPVP